MGNNKKLREALTHILHCYSDDLERQIKEIENLKQRHPHSIKLFRRVKIEEKLLTCYTYALPLSQEIIERCKKNSAKFIINLYNEGMIIEKDDGKLVLYWESFNSERPDILKHAGRRDKNFVRSKWSRGHIWKHKPLEVPLEYGDKFKYYNYVVGKEVIEQKFKEYCYNNK